MQFTASIDYAKLSKAFEKIPIVAAKELRTELNKSLRAIQVDARLHHGFKTHTAKLERSIQEDVESSGLSGKVWLEESVANYGKFVHDGTGIYGQSGKEYFVSPKSRKALYFVSGGKKMFSKGHIVKGIKPDPFLFQAFNKQKQKFLYNIRSAAKRIFDAVGL